MNEETKKLLEELKTTWTAEFKTANEELQNEIKKHGEASAESEQKLDKIQGALDDIEVRFQKLAEEASVVNRGEKPKSEQTKAFVQWLRKGDKLDVRQLVEQKVLIESDDSASGFLAPDEFVGEIIKGIVLYSPMRLVARVRPTSARASKFPKRTGTFAAAWVDELDTRSETTGLKYGLEEIPNHELIAMVDVSMDDLEDNYFNLEAELGNEAREQFGVAEGAAFVAGNGVKRPEGFLTHATLSANAVHMGDANLLTFDGVLSMAASLKDGYVDGGTDGYERGATWLMNRKTLYTIRKLKDTTGQYLWTPQFGAALINQPPALIDGRPYITMPDMPDVASNATPIAFGNFNRGYVISDRVTMAIQRDVYTQAGSGNVRFWFRKRVGGQVVLPEAIVLGKVAV